MIVLHPSADARFAVAVVTPIRITETGGGTADWNFARISYFLLGLEVERYELTANDIRAAGFSRITARSSEIYSVVFRNNADFDRVDITLGFGDIGDGRLFNVAVPFNTFSCCGISLQPLSVPGNGPERLGGVED